MTNIFLRVSLALAVSVASFKTVAQMPDAYSWSISETQNVTNLPWRKDDISEFITRITHSDEKIAVGDFIFEDLHGNGQADLVASVDYSGRELFNTLLVVRRNEDRYTLQKIPTINTSKLTGILKDLNGDGKQEILVPSPLTPYLGGAFPRVKWTAIYGWTGSFYIDQSRNFPEHYSLSILPVLQENLVHAQQNPSPLAISLAQLELDKTLRIVAGSHSEQGVEFAQSLANSADKKLRIWATSVLADIGSPAALATLEVLTQDIHPEVANYAEIEKIKGVQKHCDNISIEILDVINLNSNKPIRVAIPLAPRRGSEKNIFDIESIRFGEAGVEDSLISCNNGHAEGIICLFRSSHTGLQVSDGVATFRARRTDQSCVVGQGAAQIIGAKPL